jgi:hypothetical protein
MMSPVKSPLAFTVVASLFGTPAFATEADTNFPAGPELPAPRTDQPDFQQDDQSGAVVTQPAEGADPRPPAVIPDFVIVDPGSPVVD